MILAIEEPSGAENMLAWGTASAIILALGAIIMAATVAFQVARMKDQIEFLVDDATPSFTEPEEPRRSDVPEAIAEFVSADTDPGIPVIVEEPTRAAPRPSPVPRTDTVENDVPLQLAQASMEIDHTETGTEWREFTRLDGTVMKFKVKSST